VNHPQLGELQQAAKEFSIIQTFQNALTPEGVGSALQAVSQVSMKIAGTNQTFPVGRLVIPFVQTPANIARYAMERTPLGVFFASHQADLEAGGVRADLARSKVTLGMLSMLGVLGMAMNGRVVGRGGRPGLQACRNPSWCSIRPPGLDIWLSYDRFEPAGTLIGMVADMFQISGEAELPMWERAIVAPLYSFMKNIGSKTYFQSLNQFFDAMSTSPRTEPGTFGTNIATFAARRAAGVLQPSAFLRATARVTTPEEVDARGLIDQLYASVPGWRGEVPARRTIGGEKVLYGRGFSPDILANTLRAYSPMKFGDGMIAPADKAILDNHMGLGRPSRTLMPHGLGPGELAQAMTEVDVDHLAKVGLTPQQYERYAVLAGGNQAEASKLGLQLPTATLRAVVEGLSDEFSRTPPAAVRSLDDYLHWVIQQPEFQTASPDVKGGKEGYFKRAVLAYRSLGKQLLLAQDASLRSQMEESSMQVAVQQLPLKQRGEQLTNMRQGYREAAPRMREELGLTIGSPR
jgi:hypothetical protein